MYEIVKRFFLVQSPPGFYMDKPNDYKDMNKYSNISINFQQHTNMNEWKTLVQ